MRDGIKLDTDYSKGWVSVGTAGLSTAIGHQSVLGNPDHPATKELRRRVAMAAPGSKFEALVHTGDERKFVFHNNVDAEHFSKTGKIKPFMTGGE
jgi:hypothetical protein